MKKGASQTNLMNPNRDTTRRIIEFLIEIGLEVEHARWEGETFLPGVKLLAGRLLVDETRLLYPGDLLHEAGHLAVLPQAARAKVSDVITEADGNDEVVEVAAIAWSYAALTHLGLEPAVVFHPHGYLGNAAGLLLSFQLGVYPGAPFLQAAQMTALGERARELGAPPYPHMQKWLRD